MNDKQKLAAMGEHMAEQAVQPMCMAKRIEELEAQVRVMAVLLRDLHEHIGTSIPQTVSEHYRGCDLLDRIDSALAGKMPIQVTPECWQLVPAEPTEEMCEAGANAPLKVRQSEKCWIGDIYAAMLAAAPSPGSTK